MAESGIVDLFFLLGPTSKDVMFDFSSLVGKSTLPPLWSIAYHQCRWNYNDQADVAQVNEVKEWDGW